MWKNFQQKRHVKSTLNHRESKKRFIVRSGSTHHYWLKAKDQWKCSSCHFRTTLKSGSIMEGSEVDFHSWYKAMAFMLLGKKTISAAELQGQLDHPKYDTIWRLMHKIRSVMEKRDALYQLEEAIEFDEGYFEKATSQKVKLKTGRGSRRQMNVAVMVESTPLEDMKTGIKSRQCRYFKMKVLHHHNADTINDTVKENFDQKNIAFSDKSTCYVEIHMTDLRLLLQNFTGKIWRNQKNSAQRIYPRANSLFFNRGRMKQLKASIRSTKINDYKFAKITKKKSEPRYSIPIW